MIRYLYIWGNNHHGMSSQQPIIDFDITYLVLVGLFILFSVIVTCDTPNFMYHLGSRGERPGQYCSIEIKCKPQT